MLRTAIFTERPELIQYMPLPTGEADIWLRRNIQTYTDEIGEAYYAAEEAYMRERIAREALEADAEGWFERASAWQAKQTVSPKLTAEERISALEEENALLNEQITDAQLALCELYEMIGG